MAVEDPLFAQSNGSAGASPAADDVDAAMALIIDVVGAMPVADAMSRVVRYQNWLIGLEAKLFASNLASGASERDNERLASEGRKSTKKTAKKRAKRGAAVKENPDLADDIASGDLGPEQADAIAEAAGKTGGDAARDEELVEEIKKSAPEDANKIARRWVDGHNNPDDDGDAADRRRARQRRMRDVTRFDTEDGCAALLIKGDTESVDDMHTALKAAAKKLWIKDGGRDLPADKHSRTRRQRLFDAAHNTLTRPTINTERESEEPSSGQQSASQPKSPTEARPSGGPRSVVGHVHMWVQLDDFLAGKPRAEFADGRRVPGAVLSRYLCNGTIAATVFDAAGEVIHRGRQHRYATAAQVRGLIARDRGCVRCRADVSECEAHHLVPWNAPAKGETNIEELALVCKDCHHFIHDTNQTLYRNRTGQWKLRPATPAETPPKRRAVERSRPWPKSHHQVRHE